MPGKQISVKNKSTQMDLTSQNKKFSEFEQEICELIIE